MMYMACITYVFKYSIQCKLAYLKKFAAYSLVEIAHKVFLPVQITYVVPEEDKPNDKQPKTQLPNSQPCYYLSKM